MNFAIWIAVIACLLACCFGTCHTALKTFSRKRLADRLEAKGKPQRLEALTDRLPRLSLMTGLLRTCFSLIVVLATLDLVERSTRAHGGMVGYLVAFLIAGAAVSVFAVAIPVSWARYQREQILVWSWPMLRGLFTVTYPLTSLLYVVDPIVRRISGADLFSGEHENGITEEVLSVVEQHDTDRSVDDAQKEMIEAVFELPTTTAGEIMTPRTEVDGIEMQTELAEVSRQLIEYGHSRIPVYEESIDNIVGMLYAKDLLKFVGEGSDGPFALREVLREAFLVPESKSVRELLSEFKARKVHIAVVLDEYGGTSGVVTIEDILEEIVGEIQDEYELLEQLPAIDVKEPGTAEVEARVHIDDLNDALDTELPEDEDYETVGGFVVATLGHIPEAGESFDAQAVRFTVTAAERTKVLRVRVQRLEPQAIPAPENAPADAPPAPRSAAPSPGDHA